MDFLIKQEANLCMHIHQLELSQSQELAAEGLQGQLKGELELGSVSETSHSWNPVCILPKMLQQQSEDSIFPPK